MTAEGKRITEIFYLAFVLWREARGEPRDGKIAIVQCIQNRVEHPSWWGNSVVSVCIKPWQFSSLTDPRDPQLTKYPGEGPAWDECMEVATAVHDKTLAQLVPTADSYYAVSMDRAGNPPKWAKSPKVRFVAQVGNHKFYDTNGENPDNQKDTA